MQTTESVLKNETEVSFFENIKTVGNGEKIPIPQLLADIKKGRWEKEARRIQSIEDKDKRREEKSKLACFTVSGSFSYRNGENLISHSGYICADFDKIDNIEEVKNKLTKDPFSYAVFSSVSGKGLAVIVKIDPARHLESFFGLEKYYLDNYDYKIDESCKDVSRARYVSHDPSLFINSESEVFKNYITKKVEKNNSKSNTKIKEETIAKVEYVVQQVLDKKIILGNDSYGDWLKLGFALADGLGGDGRGYFHEVSSVSDKYNEVDCDRQYDSCLNGDKPEGRITIATFFDYAIKADIKIDKIVEDFILVDVLSLESYEKEHIPGSINIPLADIKNKAERLFKKDKEIVIYCGSFQCTMSSQAAEILTKLGYKDVYCFEGGLQYWKDAGFSLESTKCAEAVG